MRVVRRSRVAAGSARRERPRAESAAPGVSARERVISVWTRAGGVAAMRTSSVAKSAAVSNGGGDRKSGV